MMRFPHIVGFQQCQLFDTFPGHSEMNEIQMKPIACWYKVSIIAGAAQKAETGEFGRFDLSRSRGLEAKHNNGKVIVSGD